MIVRLAPEPSITTVWTGIRASGGIIVAINPSSATPPGGPGEHADEGRDQRRKRQTEKRQCADVGRSEEFHGGRR